MRVKDEDNLWRFRELSRFLEERPDTMTVGRSRLDDVAARRSRKPMNAACARVDY